MKISTLVVGLGKIGMLYKNENFFLFNNHCQSIINHNKFKLVGGVDINKKKLKKFEENYQIPSFLNFKKAYDKTNPKMIILSTPTRINDKIFDYIKKKNIKPQIFVIEKPGSYNYKHFQNFSIYCKKKKIKLFVNYQRSFSNSLKFFRNFVNSGKKIKIYINYKKGFYNSCSHYINFFFNIFQSTKYNIIKIKKYKKQKNDFFVNCQIKINRSISFDFKKTKDEKIVFKNSNGNQIQYFTEKSKIVLIKNKKKTIIKNDFYKNIKNLLDKIVKEYKTRSDFNLISSLKTLELIHNIQKKNEK